MKMALNEYFNIYSLLIIMLMRLGALNQTDSISDFSCLSLLVALLTQELEQMCIGSLFFCCSVT